MDIPQKMDFQPSKEACRLWLETRKPNHHIEGGEYPGFFSESSVSTDRFWFITAMIAEFGGLFLTCYAGAKAGGMFMVLAFILSFMFICCDVFFAVRLHRNNGKKCLLRSDKVLQSLLNNSNEVNTEERARNAAIIHDLEKKIEGGKFADFMLIVGIVLIAIIKVFGIFLLGVFNSIIPYIPILIIYFIVAYAHIYHTGFFIAFWKAQNRIYKEHRDFSKHLAKVNREPIKTVFKLRLPIMHNPHQIIAEDVQENKYVIVTTGILTDDDIINLFQGQDEANKVFLYKVCRKMQLQNFI